MEKSNILQSIDFRNLSFSDYQLMYDLLLIDNPSLGSDIESAVIKFKEIYQIDVSARQIMSFQDSNLNTDIEDLKMYYPQ